MAGPINMHAFLEKTIQDKKHKKCNSIMYSVLGAFDEMRVKQNQKKF